MAAGGVGYWGAGYWSLTYWQVHYWAGAGAAPSVLETGATPGRLTPQQIARLRGPVPVPYRQREEVPVVLEDERERDAASPLTLAPAREAVPALDLAALLGTLTQAVVLETTPLALADQARRMALAQAAEEELLTMLLVWLLDEV